MTHDPIRRRFGHGAARLPIGTSTRGPSLSHLAQTKVAHERLFSTIPAGVCLSLGVLLFFAMQTDLMDPTLVAPRDLAPRLADQSEPLEIEFWEDATVPPAAEELAAAPEHVVIAAAERPAPVQISPAPPTETMRRAQPDRTPTFDPKRLALRAPPSSPQPTDLLRTPAPAAPRGQISQRPGAYASRTPRPRIDLPTRGQPAPTSVLTAHTASRLSAKHARPGTSGAAGTSTSINPNWSANSDQRAFLTAQAEAASGSGELTGESQRPRLSPVSAAAETHAHASAIRDELSAGGWQQVPLDTLPDCSPSGRQDELKRRILRAAPYDRACTDQNGSFRFVETSNLGAFLMWSRTNPDAFERTGRDRDACVVLERALRCLSTSSNQEL